jgi:hypothetical protein
MSDNRAWYEASTSINSDGTITWSQPKPFNNNNPKISKFDAIDVCITALSNSSLLAAQADLYKRLSTEVGLVTRDKFTGNITSIDWKPSTFVLMNTK